MNKRQITVLAWILFGLIAVTVISGLIFYLVIKPAEYKLPLEEAIYSLVAVTFAFVGALILSRQPRNAIGWLMMLPGMSFTLLVDAYLEPTLSQSFIPPESPDLFFLLILWFSNWNWMLVMLTSMFIMVLFPTGQPLSRRWGWLIYLGLIWAGVMILGSTFSEYFSPDTEDVIWRVRNPIGFLPDGGDENILTVIFVSPLLIWILMSAVSLFVRFHKSSGVERAQIKWFFYACSLYALGIVFTTLLDIPTALGSFWSLLGAFVLLTIPASIAIAILRYRLYDIDILIRKTLVYGAMTLLLVVVYFGSVVLLQQVFRALTRQESPVIIVISTLVIAALFSPLRGRIQDIIDRRFYRRKYDAQQALAAFAATARDEVEMDKLTAQLLRVVEDSFQPEGSSLWLLSLSNGEDARKANLS